MVWPQEVVAQQCTVPARHPLRAFSRARQPAARRASTRMSPHRLLPSLQDRCDKRFRKTCPVPTLPRIAVLEWLRRRLLRERSAIGFDLGDTARPAARAPAKSAEWRATGGGGVVPHRAASRHSTPAASDPRRRTSPSPRASRAPVAVSVRPGVGVRGPWRSLSLF